MMEPAIPGSKPCFHEVAMWTLPPPDSVLHILSFIAVAAQAMTAALVAAGAALVTIVVARLVHRLTLAFLVLDAIGLVVFTIAGCDVAWQVDPSFPLVVVIVSGMITGCGGGVLRDILCNDVPLLFRSELYASVSVVTGLFYATAFGLKLNDEFSTALTFVLGVTLRLLAIRYKWEMPKFVFNSEPR
jgi:uncharacterized membrane protein YeiH